MWCARAMMLGCVLLVASCVAVSPAGGSTEPETLGSRNGEAKQSGKGRYAIEPEPIDYPAKPQNTVFGRPTAAHLLLEALHVMRVHRGSWSALAGYPLPWYDALPGASELLLIFAEQEFDLGGTDILWHANAGISRNERVIDRIVWESPCAVHSGLRVESLTRSRNGVHAYLRAVRAQRREHSTLRMFSTVTWQKDSEVMSLAIRPTATGFRVTVIGLYR